MALKKIKVSGLPSATSLEGLNVLGIDGATNKSAKVSIELLRGNTGVTPALSFNIGALAYGQSPTISVSGTPESPVVAIALPVGKDGEIPVFRTGAAGIEWKYVSQPDTSYVSLVSYEVLKLKFTDLSPAQKEELRGEPGAVVSATEPTNPNIKVWINPEQGVVPAGVSLLAALGDSTDAGLTQKFLTSLFALISDGMEDAVASALVELYKRVVAIETLIKSGEMGSATINTLDVLENLNVHGNTNLLVKGSGVPTAPPDRELQFYIKTSAPRAAYISTGTSSVSNWLLIG